MVCLGGKKYHSLLVRSNEMETTSGTPLSAACLGSLGPQVSCAVLEDCVLQNNWSWEINWASVASCSLIPGKECGGRTFPFPYFSFFPFQSKGCNEYKEETSCWIVLLSIVV